MTDLESLYRAVLASPEEDTPRLMYADELEGTDPARAELIRVQCELERRGSPAPNDERTYDLAIAEHELLLSKANRERWEPVCVACGGDGAPYLGVEGMKTCGACRGTGRQPCRWERGFPVVAVAEMRQVWEHIDHGRVARWQPTPWLCDLLRTHHVAGVVSPDERLIRDMNVPPRVWALWGEGGFGPDALGRAVVLAALKWLDARGAAPCQ